MQINELTNKIDLDPKKKGKNYEAEAIWRNQINYNKWPKNKIEDAPKTHKHEAKNREPTWYNPLYTEN